MLPVLSREVVEGKQRVAILDQALDSLVVFDAPGFDEGVERGECILPGLGHPDLLERTPGLRLLALGQRHWRSCAPNSAGRVSSATPPRPPARSRGRRRRPRARVPSQAPAGWGRGGAL